MRILVGLVLATLICTQAMSEDDRVVFLGDSITASWDLAHAFSGKPYINRGISGQTTSQMLERMHLDVLELRPDILVFLGGTNDLPLVRGPEKMRGIEENIRSITRLAQQNGIKVVLCSVLPTNDYTVNKHSSYRPPSDIMNLNAWMQQYAKEVEAVFADYHSALVDEKGSLRTGLSDDGLHPNVQGYARMAPVLAEAIAHYNDYVPTRP